jgi:hypothetical protein
MLIISWPAALKRIRITAFLILILLVMAGCQPTTSPALDAGMVTTSYADPTPTSAPVTVIVPQPITATTSPTPLPATTVWIDSQLPGDLQEGLRQSLTAQPATPQLSITANPNSDIRISAHTTFSLGIDIPLITRTYAVAASFPTIADSITLAALTSFWRGNAAALKQLTNNGTAPVLFVDTDTRVGLELILGAPDPKTPIQIVTSSELVDRTWIARPASFAILRFDQLEPRLKLIQVDGLNLFEKQMDAMRYPLTLVVSAHATKPTLIPIITRLPSSNNRDVSKLAIVAMTGTTAMVRGTAVQMERKGITYPGEAIRDWMLTADIRHISNEVSFWDRCPAPTFNDGVSMCSNPKYIELLKYMGINVVELSGNHLWDKGTEYLSPTIGLYEAQGWHTFAGGRTYTESVTPLTMTVAGNKLAFVGCNWFGVDWATPTNELAGSALCGAPDPHSLNLITPTIRLLVKQGYLVIATIQYEEFYQYEPNPQQERDFKALRDAGALVVNGSQGHWVQGFDVTVGGFIHYGVGNLFFGDQAGVGTHQMFVDRHAFYAGRYLGTDLRSGFIVDYSRPEPMALAERQKLLKILFAATGY